jgi:hypothetical protein
MCYSKTHCVLRYGVRQPICVSYNLDSGLVFTSSRICSTNEKLGDYEECGNMVLLPDPDINERVYQTEFIHNYTHSFQPLNF